jgi:hypothetical protein
MYEAYRMVIVLGNGKSLIFDEVAEHDLKRILFWFGVPFFKPRITLNTSFGTVLLDLSYVVAIEYDSKVYRSTKNAD